MRFQSQIWKLKSVVEKTYSLHCSSGLFRVKAHPASLLMDELERFGIFSCSKTGLLDRLNVLTKKLRKNDVSAVCSEIA